MARAYKLPPSFLAGPDDPRFRLLAYKEVRRLMVVYADDPAGLQAVCDYRQFLYDLSLTAQESLENEHHGRHS